MTEKIFALAKALGHVGSEDEDALMELCALSERELRFRLREDVHEEDCEEAFRTGAAWLALSGLCVAGERIEGFTAGGLTVKHGGGLNAMERSGVLRQRCEETMRPYLKDEGFVFQGVRG